jgi:MFS transporter, SET family, sugar efflux transporter
MQRLLVPLRTILRHRDFVVLLGCNLLIGLAYSFVGPFVSMFGTLEVKMSPVVFSVFMTITSVSAIVLTTILARWSDTHLSRRTVLVLGGGCGALGYVGYAFVRDVVWLTVIGSTFLAVSAITFSQLFAQARDLLPRLNVDPRDTPLYMNVFRLFFALSWTVGPAIASWVMVLYSYRGMFLVAALLFLVFMLVVHRCVPELPPPAQGAARTPLAQALRRPDLLAYFAGFVLVFMSATMCMLNLPLLVLDTLGGNARHVGIIYSVAPVFELPFMVYFGLLASRGDQAGVIRTGVFIAVIYYLALSLVQAPWHVYPLQMLGAAATAVTSGVAITFFQNYLPGQAGTATNLYASAQRLGSTIGYLLFGVLLAAFGHRTLFVICGGLCAVTLLLFFVQSRRPAWIASATA